jgi:hypothetical protein
MREAIKKLKNLFWGEYLIGTILFGMLTALLLGVSISSANKLSNAKNEAAEYFHCEEVVFGFNADEDNSEPLGYYVEARNYTPSGEMTKTYERHEKAKEWHDLEANSSLITAITGLFGAICGIITLIELYFLISGIIFIRRFNKQRAESAIKRIATE